MKKILILVVSLVIVAMVFTACKPSEAETATAETQEKEVEAKEEEEAPAETKQAEPYKFAFIMYNWEDNQGLYLKSYCDYLTNYFNIEWEFITAGPDADTVIEAVETLATAGDVDVIFNSMTSGFQSWAEICKENQIYFTVPLNVPDADDMDYAATNEYYLGSAQYSDLTPYAMEYGEELVSRGYKKLLVTGFVPGIINQCQQIIAGLTAVIEEHAETDPEYSIEVLVDLPENLFPSITAAISDPTKEFDILFGTISTMDFCVANVYAADMVGKVKVAGFNADQTAEAAFQAGVLDSITDNFTAVMGVNVVYAINALEGNTLPGTPPAANIEPVPLFIGDLETLATYRQYVMNDDYSVHGLTGEELQQFILSLNPDATYADFETYINESTIQKIAERHAE